MLIYGERWLRPIPGEPGFFARADSTIWTRMIAPVNQHTDWREGSIWYRVPEQDACHGYRRVKLRTGRKYLHRVMLETFKGPCPANMESCHWPDPCRMNNKLWNLKYGTHKENNLHKRAHGTNGAALSKEDALRALELYSRGHAIFYVALLLNVSVATVSRAIRGESPALQETLC